MQSLELKGVRALVIKVEGPNSKAKDEHNDLLVLNLSPTDSDLISW